MKIQDVVKKIFDIAGDNGSDYRSMYIDENNNITLTIHFRKKEETETIRLIALDMDGNEYDLTPSKIDELKTEERPKTYLEDVLEKYPDLELYDSGAPVSNCPRDLYPKYKHPICASFNSCIDCWNRPMEIKEE